MPANRNGEAGTSPNWAILTRHVESPDFTPPALVRQAHRPALQLGIPFGSTSAWIRRRPS